MTTHSHQAAAPPTPPVADRLDALEKRVDHLKPDGKDFWDKAEKLSSAFWAIVTLLVSVFVTGRIETALKERELHLENVKDMQQLMQDLDKADAGTAMSCALALGAHGRYAVAPMIQVLQAGVVDHRAAAVAGLRAAAAIDGPFVCDQLVGVIRNRTRLYQVEVHESATRLLGDLNCDKATDPLRNYLAQLDHATVATAPFTEVPGSQGLSQGNIDDVRKQARTSLDALSQH